MCIDTYTDPHLKTKLKGQCNVLAVPKLFKVTSKTYGKILTTLLYTNRKQVTYSPYTMVQSKHSHSQERYRRKARKD